MFTRVQILDFPQAHPGKCAMCGSQTNNDGRKYIDFGLSVPSYGALVFCSHCFAEINEHLGWYSPAVVNRLKLDWEADSVELKGVKEENERLRRALTLLDFIPSLDISGSRPVGALPEPDVEQGSSDKQSVDLAKRPAKDKQRPAKPANVRGSQNVPNDELAKLLGGSI